MKHLPRQFYVVFLHGLRQTRQIIIFLHPRDLPVCSRKDISFRLAVQALNVFMKIYLVEADPKVILDLGKVG